MQQLEKYKELIRKLPFDIRVEVVLAEMLADNVQLDDIEITSNSVFFRNFHYDIEKVEDAEYVSSRKKRLRFVVNRDGLYDSLPEDVIHQSGERQPYFEKDKMMQEIKLQQQREQAARTYFLPYEQEFFRLRVKLEWEERRFMFANSGHVDTSVLGKLWEFSEVFDDEQKSKLGALMPAMHQLAGKKELCSFLATQITGDEVEIKDGHKLWSDYSGEPKLGEATLGNGFFLGGQYQSMEPMDTWNIKVKDTSRLTDYMPGGKKAQMHQFLSNLMTPLENDVQMELDLRKEQGGFVLDDQQETFSHLGYETYI
jgi:type VI secretion system protein ImpH